jgi:hemerythrin-like domain-containing protein
LEKYLNTPIKELITQFPEVGRILENFEIGCVPCNVGTCLFKDILEIHNLSPQDEEDLMTQIACIIYPDMQIALPKIKRKKSTTPGQFQYSPPMKKLVEEHTLIKKVLALIPKIIGTLDLDSEEGRNRVQGSIDFIRFFADKYHHAKEEDILFEYFDKDSEILQVMYADHTTGRGHVKAMLEAIDRQDRDTLGRHLLAYRELLSGHIQKEDEILFPWMDRNLSTTQVGELFAKFNEVDEKMGFSPDKYLNFIEKLELQFNVKEE